MAQKKEEPDLWERQPGESGKSYDKFCVYRDMGTYRSLRKAAKELGVTRQTLEQLSVRYDWSARALAYDEEMERVARAENEKRIRQMRENHARIAVQLTAKAARGLMNLDERTLAAADIARLIEVGVKIERLSRGESTENTAVSQGFQGHFMPDMSQLTTEELKRLAALSDGPQDDNEGTG